jgi:[ribosomal protein S5]-alanine N-acetyltransferase
MYPILETEHLLLRGLAPEDAPSFNELKEDPWIADNGLSVAYPYSVELADKFIRRTQPGPEKHQYTWGMIFKKDESLIGLASLFVIPQHHHAQIGYWIGKEYRSQGYTSEATYRVMEYGFAQYQLHRIYGQTFTHNPASIRVMEKLGMQYEATLRQHVFHDSGVYRDLHVYGILRSEFEPL